MDALFRDILGTAVHCKISTRIIDNRHDAFNFVPGMIVKWQRFDGDELSDFDGIASNSNTYFGIESKLIHKHNNLLTILSICSYQCTYNENRIFEILAICQEGILIFTIDHLSRRGMYTLKPYEFTR